MNLLIKNFMGGKTSFTGTQTVLDLSSLIPVDRYAIPAVMSGNGQRVVVAVYDSSFQLVDTLISSNGGGSWASGFSGSGWTRYGSSSLVSNTVADFGDAIGYSGGSYYVDNKISFNYTYNNSLNVINGGAGYILGIEESTEGNDGSPYLGESPPYEYEGTVYPGQAVFADGTQDRQITLQWYDGSSGSPVVNYTIYASQLGGGYIVEPAVTYRNDGYGTGIDNNYQYYYYPRWSPALVAVSNNAERAYIFLEQYSSYQSGIVDAVKVIYLDKSENYAIERIVYSTVVPNRKHFQMWSSSNGAVFAQLVANDIGGGSYNFYVIIEVVNGAEYGISDGANWAVPLGLGALQEIAVFFNEDLSEGYAKKATGSNTYRQLVKFRNFGQQYEDFNPSLTVNQAVMNAKLTKMIASTNPPSRSVKVII